MAHLLAAGILQKGTRCSHAHIKSCRWSWISQRLSSSGNVPDQEKASTPSLLSRLTGKHCPAAVPPSNSPGADEHDSSHTGCNLLHSRPGSLCGEEANVHNPLHSGLRDILCIATASRGRHGPPYIAWLQGAHARQRFGLANQCARVAFAANLPGSMPGFARGFASSAEGEGPEDRAGSLIPPECRTSAAENGNQDFTSSAHGVQRYSPTAKRHDSPNSVTGSERAGGTGSSAAVLFTTLAGRRGVRGMYGAPGGLGAERTGAAGEVMSASVHSLAGRHSVRDLYWPHGSSGCSPPPPPAPRRTPVMPLHLDFNQDVRIMEANSVLQRMQVLQFREHLEDISEEQHTISHAQLVALCRDSGAAATRAEAERVCEALNMAGIVLRYRDVVYLRPSEVSEIILEALPDTFSDLNAKLQNLRQVLEPLEKHKMEVDLKARRFSTIMLRCGFILLFVQWAIFVRLTFWDLGWDFMEPITYYTTTFVGLVAYAYYLNYRRSFDFQSMDNHLTSDLQEKGYAAKGIDMARYKRLQRDIERYERYLEYLKERPGMVAPQASGLDKYYD